MKEHLIRLFLDLFYTACYLYLTHIGYNIIDNNSENKEKITINIIIWVFAAFLLFFLTKQRYDKETEEGKNDI